MNPKQQSILFGAVIGALLGALGGYLFTRGLELPKEPEEPQRLSLRSVPPGDMVKVAIAILGVMRGVSELGERL